MICVVLDMVQGLDPQNWPIGPTSHDFWAMGDSQKLG
jgi:hypothetical protein